MQRSNSLKRILSIIILVVVVVTSQTIAGWFVTPVKHNDYLENTLKEFEENGEDIDLVFLGASRTLYSFNPQYFEETMGIKNAVNFASPLQTPTGSYYQLVEILKTYHPKYVILGVTWNEMLEEHAAAFKYKSYVYDRLSGINKWNYFRADFDFDDLPKLLIPLAKDSVELDMHPLKKYQKKKEVKASHYTKLVNNNTVYYHGFDNRKSKYKDGDIKIKPGVGGYFDPALVDKSKEEYLTKIINLCKENDIQIELVSGVTTIMVTGIVDNYQGTLDYFNELAAKNGIIYHNVSMLRDRESWLHDSMMRDYNHTADTGAAEVSKRFAEVLKVDFDKKSTAADKQAVNEKYFYQTEKEFWDDVTRVASIGCDYNNDGKYVHLTIHTIKGNKVTPMYCVLGSMSGEDTKHVILDWTYDSDLQLDSSTVAKYDYITVKSTDENAIDKPYSAHHKWSSSTFLKNKIQSDIED